MKKIFSLIQRSRHSRSKTLCLNEKEKFAERCEVTIDETGVKGPAGHITNVVQWTKEHERV